MLGLWLKLKVSAKLVAWAAPKVQKNVQEWKMEREFNRVEGNRQLQAQNFAQAEIHLSDAIAEGNLKNSPTIRIQLHLQLAEALRKQDKLAEAETTVRAALELTARMSNAAGYVRCLDALAEVFHDRGDFPGMEAILEQGVKIEAAMPHPDPLRMARRIHRLGIARYLQGLDGLPPLEKAIEIFEGALGEDHLETAGALTEAGILYRAAGRHEEAQTCLGRALKIHQRELGSDSEEAIRDLHSLAGSHEDAGDIESAAALYERALEWKDQLVGSNQDDLAEIQFAAASLYVDWGNFSRARELLAMCIGTFKGKKGPRLAVAYELLAHIDEYSGRFPDAIAELERAGKIWESCGAERSLELAINLEYRAGLLDQLKKKDSAKWLREKAAAARAGGSN